MYSDLLPPTLYRVANPLYCRIVPLKLRTPSTREMTAAEAEGRVLNMAFEEKFHWHVRKPISDEFERMENGELSEVEYTDPDTIGCFSKILSFPN